jgi:hypothetical protein
VPHDVSIGNHSMQGEAVLSSRQTLLLPMRISRVRYLCLAQSLVFRRGVCLLLLVARGNVRNACFLSSVVSLATDRSNSTSIHSQTRKRNRHENDSRTTINTDLAAAKDRLEHTFLLSEVSRARHTHTHSQTDRSRRTRLARQRASGSADESVHGRHSTHQQPNDT